MAARATAGRRPPPPRTNRSLPGGGRFMKWGRWQGEGRRRDCQGASSPLPALHSSQVLPPWRERWEGCCSSGGALYLGCTAAEWTQLHNGPHTSDSPLLVHPVSSDSQLIPTSTSGSIENSSRARIQTKKFWSQKKQGGLYTDHNTDHIKIQNSDFNRKIILCQHSLTLTSKIMLPKFCECFTSSMTVQ